MTTKKLPSVTLLQEDLDAVSDREDRDSAPFERLRDALYELRTHRETAKGDRDLGRLCLCGHVRGEHLLGRGSCGADEGEEGCDCGVFRPTDDGAGDADYDLRVESPSGLATVRVRSCVGAGELERVWARSVGTFAAAELENARGLASLTRVPVEPFAVLVNGAPCVIVTRRVTYAEVVELARMTGTPSVTWRLDKRGQAGVLGPGADVTVEDGMTFRVVHTGGG